MNKFELGATKHFGVYAAIETGKGLVVIRKSRGPYKGFLDLPGGRPELDETWEQTLTRELNEELGVSATILSDWHSFSCLLHEDSTGKPIHFLHEGVWCKAGISNPPIERVGEDVEGFEEVPLDQILRRKDVSLALRMVAAKLEESREY